MANNVEVKVGDEAFLEVSGTRFYGEVKEIHKNVHDNEVIQMFEIEIPDYGRMMVHPNHLNKSQKKEQNDVTTTNYNEEE